MTDLRPLGDRAWLASFESDSEARGWAIRATALDGVLDVVVAYSKVAVHFDPDRADPLLLRDCLAALASEATEAEGAALHEMPTWYDGADLDEAAERLGLTPSELIAAHSGSTYTVYAVGFLPGFPYAGPLPEILRGLPRRESPRPRVPAGSVAIVGGQTAIYPRDSPGGWQLIGRTPLLICDPESRSFPIRTGDRVRFVPIGRGEYEARLGEWLGSGPGLNSLDRPDPA